MSTLARSPIYDRKYTEKPATACLGNPVVFRKPNVLQLLVQQDKKFSEVFRKPKFSQFSAMNPREKFIRSRNFDQNPLLNTLVNPFCNSSDMHYLEQRCMR